MKIEYFKDIENEPNQKTHIVKPAQTYAAIANIYGLDVGELKAKNNDEPLFLGKKILIG